MTLFTREWPYVLPDHERSVLLAYALWMLWGVLGVHRLYLGKWRTGLLFAVTGGLFGLGWLYDLATLPWQVTRCNAELAVQRPGPAVPEGKRDPQRALLAAAARRDGVLTVTMGVMETGLPFARVEAELRAMLVAGYVDVRNDPETGVVQYVFPELVSPPEQERSVS